LSLLQNIYHIVDDQIYLYVAYIALKMLVIMGNLYLLEENH
jgi:hypothetical protein